MARAPKIGGTTNLSRICSPKLISLSGQWTAIGISGRWPDEIREVRGQWPKRQRPRNGTWPSETPEGLFAMEWANE
uniref:Uncharacterized protein n=1 Tax=Globodera rostochiensis TaxID=31243 RepID=A0A914HWL5_GLORO